MQKFGNNKTDNFWDNVDRGPNRDREPVVEQKAENIDVFSSAVDSNNNSNSKDKDKQENKGGNVIDELDFFAGGGTNNDEFDFTKSENQNKADNSINSDLIDNFISNNKEDKQSKSNDIDFAFDLKISDNKLQNVNMNVSNGMDFNMRNVNMNSNINNSLNNFNMNSNLNNNSMNQPNMMNQNNNFTTFNNLNMNNSTQQNVNNNIMNFNSNNNIGLGGNLNNNFSFNNNINNEKTPDMSNFFTSNNPINNQNTNTVKKIEQPKTNLLN